MPFKCSFLENKNGPLQWIKYQAGKAEVVHGKHRALDRTETWKGNIWWLEAGTCYMEEVQRQCLMKAKKVNSNMKNFFRESWWERSLTPQWDKGPGDKNSGKGFLQNALLFNPMIQTFWIHSVKKKEHWDQQIKLQKNTI